MATIMEPFDTIIGYLRAGKSGTLATIISRVGAAPRAAGAKVFVGDDGQVYGTIGGGCVEAEVWQQARGGPEAAGAEKTPLRHERQDR